MLDKSEKQYGFHLKVNYPMLKVNTDLFSF